MNIIYDKVIEFFSEHETAIYGFGPTDDGAEEGTLLWCIKELDSMFDINVYIDNRDMTIKQRTLKVICTLIDIYEKEDANKRELNAELKPCPFCGNKIAPTIMTIAEIECDESDEWARTHDEWAITHDEWARTHYSVVCNHNHADTIGCGASTGYYANSPEEAADIWNRRADNG